MPRWMDKLGEPDRLSVYRDARGDAMFAIARWNKSDGKDMYPIVWDGKAFVSAGYDKPRPVYNADIIVTTPMAPILVVEGEKAAEDGQRYLPSGWLIATWAGGTNAVHKTDWSIMAGRRVVVWPDNDAPGLKAADAVAEKVREAGGICSVITPSKNYPKGWDLADPLPSGVTETMVLANILSANAQALIDDDPAVADVDDLPLNNDAPFRPLGYDDKFFYIMPAATKIILKLTARELMAASGLLQVVNDFDFWAEAYPAKKGSSGRADWESAGSWVMLACQRVGFYDPRRIRGRGVWTDEGRVVVHTGDTVLVDGKPVNPASLRSRFIYKTAESLFLDGIKLSDAATDADGRLVVDLCNSARWERSIFGDLLAGYIATSLVCGGMRWRTHVWVTGNSGSGKSTVINNIVSACVGDVALYPLGETTESGIRQTVGNDALPVIFDEMEGTDERGNRGAARRDAIIQLMRMASSESRGRIMKGSASHSAVSFTMRSSFLVASIGMSLKEAPDLTRTLVLGLKPLSSDASAAEKQAATEQFALLNRLAGRIPHDMPHRLFARLTNLLPVIHRNAEIFREVISDELGNRRLGDQIGSLLAGRCALTSPRVMTEKECRDYVKRVDWVDVIAAPSEREDRALLSHLRQALIRASDIGGHTHERTIGELVMTAFDELHDGHFTAAQAVVCLMRYGIRVDTKEGIVWIAKAVATLNTFMRDSSNPTDWMSVVSRYPGAKSSSQAMRFAGSTSRAVGIPRKAFIE